MNNIDERNESFETKAIHSSRDFISDTFSISPPLWLTSTFEYGNPNGFDYTRSGNPNFTLLERTISRLESSSFATSFASGVSAITAIISTLKSGDLILAEENIYGCTFRLLDKIFKKFGVEVIYTDFTNIDSYKLIYKHSPKIVWIESPTNPNLKIIDIQAIANITTKLKETFLLVDNTFSSSYIQRPIELGADLSLISLTKYSNGHSDALAGAICTNSKEWNEKMIFAQKALGLQPSPMDAWLVLRGVKTQAIRMDKHCSNALEIAQLLNSHKKVKKVIYPFLTSHPQYEIARKQMRGGSGIITIEIDADLKKTLTFIKSLKYFPMAESLGAIESLVSHPASMTHSSIPKKIRESIGITDSLVRLSIGVENSKDLIKDLNKSLDIL